MFRLSFVLVASFGFAAAGCVPSLNGSQAREVNKQVPKTFSDVHVTEGSPGDRATSEAQKTWNEFFVSADLIKLIEAGLKNNQELNLQLQELIIAQNEIAARQGEYLPQVGAFAGAGVEKVGKHTSQGASDEALGLPQNLGNFQFGLRGSWEVDVWSRLRNATKAARLRYLATIEARNFLITQIVAEIARSYYDLIALDNELDVIRRNIDIQSNALDVVKLQKQAGRVTELAVQRFQAEVLKNRSRLYDVEQDRTQTENRINFLIGRYPQPVARKPEEFAIPLPVTMQTGLPAALLANRPDVRQAELELEASKLEVKSAKAAFYPSLTIDAEVGYRSFNVAHLLQTPASLAYGVAGALTAPLLNRRAIQAQYRSANARQIQAVFRFEKTLLQAFTDVANQMSLVANLRRGAELQAEQVETLARSVEVSGTLFQSARADYLEVLLTRRDFLEAQLSLIETKKRQLQAIVNIYQALGGGWKART